MGRAFLAVFSFAFLITVEMFAAPGDFDPTFGVNGQAIFTFPNTGSARNLAFQADGKIVLASSSFNSSNQDFAVLRLNSNGTIDNSFGTDGKVVIPFDNLSNEEAVAVAVQSDGKILVTGYVEFGSPGYDFGVARLNSDGSLDSSFGNGGKVKIPVSNSNDFPSDMALQSDGKIIIVGKGFNQPNSDAALIRLNSDGTLDTSFNGNGKIVTPIVGGTINEEVFAVAIQPDGKIVAAGHNGADFAVLRFNPNGSFDTTFDSDGIATTSIGSQRDEASSVALQSDGKIVLGGFANSGSFNQAAIVRYNPDGSLDTTFDGDGKTTIDIEPFSSEDFKSVLVQSDGKIIGVAVGSGKYNLVRYNPNGSLDSTFGTNGVKTATVGNGQNGPNKGALQADGKLVVSGSNSTGGVAVVRFLTANAAAKTMFDYDGDGKADISVFRPSADSWYLSQSSNNAFVGIGFGVSTDAIVPADFDGDGKTDIAVFRPSAGAWYRLNSSNGSFSAVQFGSAADVPVPADFDGDGRADVAVYRQSAGAWYRLNSSNGQFVGIQFGIAEDKPALGDFDGDGKDDVSVFRPSSSSWYRLNSSDNQFVATQFGAAEDRLVPADYDGDGKTDIAVFRPSNGSWYRLNSSNGQFIGAQFGISEDKPVPADYDGDGKTDLAVFRPSSGSWYLLRSTQGFTGLQFGAGEDVPTPNAFIR
jgi:uncharacterized delta-60 repeat protein